MSFFPRFCLRYGLPALVMIYFQPVLFKVEFRIRIWGVAVAAGLYANRLEDFVFGVGVAAVRAMADLFFQPLQAGNRIGDFEFIPA